MAEKMANLLVRIGADVSDFRTGLNDANKRSKSFATQLGGASKQLIKYGAAAAAAGAAIATHLVRQKLQAIDADAKLAARLGQTMETMATLNRVADLTGVSLNQMTTATRTLDVNMGKAAQGVGAQAKAFDALGVSVEHLQSLPVDERIAAINQALRENVNASERAAVAADIFGSRNAQALSLIDSDVIERARKEAELFGTALSDVDGIKVEQANDAMSRISMAIDGVVKQFTVQLAPVLQMIGDMFFDVAEEAGGVGDVAERSFDKVVDGAVFAANAADALKRAFEVTADGIIAGLSKAAEWISRTFASILENISRLPGVDFSDTAESLREFSETAADISRQAMESIDETLMAPLAGDDLRERIEEAREIAEEMAQEEAERRREHQEILTHIDKEGMDERLADKKEHERDMLNETWSAGNDLLSAAGKTNDQLTKVAQVSGAAQALISTLVGQAEALKLPFPANLAAVAKVGAVGFGLVNSIKGVNTSSGGGGGRGSGGGGGGAAASGGGGGPVEQRQVADVTFNVSGGGMMRDLARQLVEPMNDLRRDGYEIGSVGVA